MSDALPRFEEYVIYNPDTGHFFWIKARGKRQAGSRADTHSRSGYRRIKVEGRCHSAHRVAWYLMNGGWPDSDLDHVNCDKADNRWHNLRAATKSQNEANKFAISGLKGTALHKGTGRYQAQITHENKYFYLGLFETEELANAAYAGAAKVLFGKFARSS